MIKKLQVRFILITMIASIVVTSSLYGIILFEKHIKTEKQNDGILNMIAENGGEMPEYRQRDDYMSDVITKEAKYSTRFFYVKTDENNVITETNLKNIAAVSEEEAEDIAEDVLNDAEKNKGYYNNFKYLITNNGQGKIVIFLDCTLQKNAFNSSVREGFTIIIIGLIIVFIIISIFSKRVMKPIIKNIENQKQFVTNAGHELKTPVAVIMADTDVLEMTANQESQEWIQSIKSQAKRLDILIKSLLNLANVEEKGNKEIIYSKFNVTDLIKDEITAFKAMAQNKEINFDDSKEVYMNADQNSIAQLITIFLDNAIKYTPDGGKIDVIAETNGKTTRLQFLNDCENPDNINTKKLFDRFYRDDKSRNKKKEGYGIGLSIAKSIVELHKGKISAEINKDKRICFTIII